NYLDVVFVTGKKEVIRGTLKEMEILFNQQHLRVLRVSKDILINYAFIERIDAEGKVIFKESFLSLLTSEVRAKPENNFLTALGRNNHKTLLAKMDMQKRLDGVEFWQLHYKHISIATEFSIPN